MNSNNYYPTPQPYDNQQINQQNSVLPHDQSNIYSQPYNQANNQQYNQYYQQKIQTQNVQQQNPQTQNVQQGKQIYGYNNQQKKKKYTFEPGNDADFDNAMKSLDNLYDNMFNDNIQPTSDEALAARSIDDMYSDIMGTKTKEEYQREKEERKRREQQKELEQQQQQQQMQYQQSQQYCIGVPVMYYDQVSQQQPFINQQQYPTQYYNYPPPPQVYSINDPNAYNYPKQL